MFTINRNPSPSDLRAFGRAMLIGFGFLGLLAWLNAWRRADVSSIASWAGSGWQLASLALWAIAIGLFTMSRLSPAATRSVYVTWMSVTVPIGIAMSTILLTSLYIGLLPVFAIIARLADPMRKRWGERTYWEKYTAHEPTLERMKRPF